MKNGTVEAETMRAWRTHVYGEHRDVLKLDSVSIPEPHAASSGFACRRFRST
jgi:hypothetical protein